MHPLCCFLFCVAQGRDVVVVDDIIDTGVRLQETVKLLKGAGARQYVNGLCFAFPCGIVYGSTKGFVSYLVSHTSVFPYACRFPLPHFIRLVSPLSPFPVTTFPSSSLSCSPCVA